MKSSAEKQSAGRQAFNPYLPSFEYVPVGEPHIFNNRLYIYGSHEAFNGPAFCCLNYVCWSAPLDDLSDWKYEGVIYNRHEDPADKKGNQNANAPDVCQGPDGRYYLYYQLHQDKGCSVAVSDKPEGPFRYYGAVTWPDGKAYGSKKGDAYPFDPGILVDDDGRIYLYTGFGLGKGGFRTLMKLRGGKVDDGSVVELAPDMLTIIGKQHATVPGPIHAAGTPYEGHAFFEASSPRKINGKYYLVYSSEKSHELCYATAGSPTGPWTYGGTIVSIGDIGLPGVTDDNARNFTGNTHGGMVEVNGQWYIFYHRQTNQQKCCRQACAEPITILPDGSIPQVEVTSCGLNGKPLKGKGRYEARIACNLKGAKGTFAYTETRHKQTEYPYFTQSGEDREDHPDQYIANMQNGAVAGFKYFDLEGSGNLGAEVRGNGKGELLVSLQENGSPVCRIPVQPSVQWQEYSSSARLPEGKSALFFRFEGEGALDLNAIILR